MESYPIVLVRRPRDADGLFGIYTSLKEFIEKCKESVPNVEVDFCTEELQHKVREVSFIVIELLVISLAQLRLDVLFHKEGRIQGRRFRGKDKFLES
jgi:hypothetical protein